MPCGRRRKTECPPAAGIIHHVRLQREIVFQRPTWRLSELLKNAEVYNVVLRRDEVRQLVLSSPVPGEIYESNGPMLEAILRRAGCDVTRMHPVADDPDAHRASLAAALAADVVVTSAGVSVGPHDLVRSTLAELGVEEVFWGVAMRPGKPLMSGAFGQAAMLGLPGNPVSALVCGALFLVPMLRAMGTW